MRTLTRCALLLAPAVLMAAAPLRLLAQEAVPATQPAVAPAVQPAVPPVAPTVPAVAPITPAVDPFALHPAAHGPTTQITLNFKDAPIDAVLDQLSSMAGFVVVKEQQLTGRVTVLSKQPVSPEEAVALLNAVLKTNGYAAIQSGRILTVTTRDKAKRANVPVFFGADPTEIPQTETMRTQVIPMRSVDAVKLKKDLDTIIGKDADVSSNASSNTLIITDTAVNIFRIVTIIANLDSRDASHNTILVKQLLYADAASAAKLVTDIFVSSDPDANAQPGTAGFYRAINRGFNQQQQPQDTEKGNVGKITASSDIRTNTVVVTGPPETLKAVEDMLTKLDANPSSEQTFFLYALKNGQSANMADVLNSLFGNPTSSSSSSNNSRQTNSSGRNTSSFGGSSSSRSSSSSSRGGGGNSNSSSASNTQQISRGFNQGSANGQRGGVSNAVAGAAAALAGQVLIVADPDTNSLLVSTATKYQQQVRDIIAQLDRPVPQVLIKVLIAEVSHDNTNDFGVDFSILNTRASGNGQSAITSFGAPSNGLVVSVLESNVQATLHALATAGKLDVLSRPYILASDNQEASITVGQTVPIIVQSDLDVNNNAVNQIEYQDIGIILDVTPHINPDGLVIMDVAPQVSSFSDQTVPISSTVNAPVFNLRSADSRVGIKDGETIVIGGMMEDRKIQTVSKVPLLGDIPLIGLMFQRTIVDKTKTELLFFLTPHAAKAPDMFKPMSDDERNGLRLVPNAVQPGTFQEHIEGLNRGGAIKAPPVDVAPPSKDTRIPEPPLPGTK